MSKKKKDQEGWEKAVVSLKYLLLIKFIEAKDLIQEDNILSQEEKEEGLMAVKELIFLIGKENSIIEKLGVNHLEKQLLLQFGGEVKEGSAIHQRLNELFANKVVMYITAKFIDEFIKEGKYNRTVEKEEGLTKGKFKRSGHLTDQMLKYSFPSKNSPQLSIWDSLQDATRKDIAEAQVERKEVVEGIRLSPSETKVIDCLCKLLHETSQNLNPKKSNYYAGNIGSEMVQFGEEKEIPAPKLAFTLYELTKEYKGGEAVSGKDVDNIKQILTELDAKRFLLSYVETTKIKGGGRIERKIEDFKKLIHIVKISETEYSKEDIELSKTEETVIVLNPIFRRQIDSKFILYPNDINKRTFIAYGSHNISEIALRLRDYLMRELSSKRYSPEITLNKLYHLLAEKWMRESRKKKVKEYTDKALETVIALGLLLSYEIKTGSTGEPKVVFKINKDWE